jgi:cytochrome c peroxidase
MDELTRSPDPGRPSTKRGVVLAIIALSCACVMWQGRTIAAGRVPVPEAYLGEEIVDSAPWSPQMAALGKRLFSDPLLSRDRSVSCATCHDPERAFTDGEVLARGIDGQVGPRNTPTVVNRALGRSQFWDGRAATLQEQALGPISNPREMDLPIEQAVARLRQDPAYDRAFRAAFGGEPREERLGAALAAYEKTLFFVDSPFDRFIAWDAGALSPSAQRGLALFGVKARCGECHLGANFTDELFHALGIEGEGRGAVTRRASEIGAYKTPTLRGVGLTAPYMHDGSIPTLAEVVEYYDKGGTPHPNLSDKITKLSLTDQEKADLVAFLESLTGTIVEAGLDKEETKWSSR